MLLAVDLGNGWTKAVGNGRSFAEPSVVGTSTMLLDEFAGSRGVSVFDEGDREYFVGDLAINQSDIKFFTISDNKPQERITGLLLEAAVACLVGESRGVALELVTGLPVDHFFTQREALGHRVQAMRRVKAKVHGREVVAPIMVSAHKAVPQPFGSAADLVLDDRGEIARGDLARQHFLVVDVGFHTVDLLALDNLQIIQAHSRSVPYGLAVAYQALAKRMNGIPLWEVDRRMRANRVTGFEVYLQDLAAAITADVTSLNQEFDFYLVTGGGGEKLYPFLLPGAPMVLAKDPTMSNVRGYLKLGQRAWKTNAV